MNEWHTSTFVTRSHPSYRGVNHLGNPNTAYLAQFNKNVKHFLIGANIKIESTSSVDHSRICIDLNFVI